ncbi:hypothetical protein BOQ54_14850 [Chelatococcus daeguensis]|uniref:Alkaline proteinase inhibitor/ Outer membrane lipoprotein Omp19 domain-containing protein n=1 Tax=Chelatococcus daeguensis TaxID=444444 RepID=A0AAC9NZS0_9HYPH|nr:hypothetical protein BOQ54_14850 [Chelatococcus daeguensis]
MKVTRELTSSIGEDGRDHARPLLQLLCRRTWPLLSLIVLAGCNAGDFNSCERYYTSPWNPPMRCYRPLPPSLEVEAVVVAPAAAARPRGGIAREEPMPSVPVQPPPAKPTVSPAPTGQTAAGPLPAPKVVKGYTPPQASHAKPVPQRSQVSGRWRMTEAGGKACELVLTNAGLLDQYRASTNGCASEALRSINGWDLKGGEVVLYARGAMIARLAEDHGGYRGVVLSSGAGLALAR